MRTTPGRIRTCDHRFRKPKPPNRKPTQSSNVEACFLRAYEEEFAGVRHDTFTTRDVGHGRREERLCTVIYQPRGLRTEAKWTDLQAIVQMIRTRQVGEKESVEVSYYISSSQAAAQVLAEGIRTHWSIENRQHWCLDVLFGHDRCRARHQHAAENLAWIRNVALGLFRQDDTKELVPIRRFRAALDEAYRTHLTNLLSIKYA